MSGPAVQEQDKPTRPLREQFMADIDLHGWIERRCRETDKSASEFLYEIVAKAKADEEKAA